jgi:DNA invertase Pin-like site-specific DNA recombinase
MPALKAVPAYKPRAILYLRQSSGKDEESISLELQETACRDYADRQGYEVVAVEADPGISGRTWKRPGVVKVMDMIESKKADVIVLWRWSRLSRSRMDWAVAADRVQTAGGRIESALENVDVSTSTGRLARGVLTEFAAFESERIGEGWKETHARRIKQGLPANGKPRFGYAYSREDGFVPDPETGPVLAEMYRRYTSGQSLYTIVSWLNGQGISTVPGYGGNGIWSHKTARNVLDSGFGAGLLLSKGAHYSGAHESVISMEEWEEYLSRRESRRTRRRGERSSYMLSGLTICGQCGSAMSGGSYLKKDGTRSKVTLTCAAVRNNQAHKGGSTNMLIAEEAVMVWLKGLAEEINTAAASSMRGKKIARVASKSTETIARDLAKLEARSDMLTNKFLDGTIPETSYTRLSAEIASKKEALEASLRAAKVAVRNPVAELVPDLLSQWDRLDVSVQRDLLSRLINKVVVTAGRPRATVRVVPAWEPLSL